MKRNKSLKENVVPQRKPSRSRQISIELEASLLSKGNIDSYTQRINQSPNWQNHTSLSNNILKEIMNYSNIQQPTIPQPHNKTNKSTTLAIYQKYQHQDNSISQSILSTNRQVHTNLINSGQSSANLRRDSKKLVIDQNRTKMIESILKQDEDTDFRREDLDLFQNSMKRDQIFEGKSFLKSKTTQSHDLSRITQQNQSSTPPDSRNDENNQLSCQMPEDWSYKRYNSLKKEKQKLTMKIDEIQFFEDNLKKQYIEIIPHWLNIVNNENRLQRVNSEMVEITKRSEVKKINLQKLSDLLFEVNRSYISSKRLSEYKSNDSKDRTLFQTEKTHDELLKKMNVRDFEETILFNIKVVIPNSKPLQNITAVYEELFKNKCAKKYTMILKKHSLQMDLYDSKLLNQYIKKIVELESQFQRPESLEAPTNDINYLFEIEGIVENIQQEKLSYEKLKNQLNVLIQHKNNYEELLTESQDKINDHIESVNKIVKSDYSAMMEKSADFKALLEEKYKQKFQEFKSLKKEKDQIMNEVEFINKQLEPINQMLFK